MQSFFSSNAASQMIMNAMENIGLQTYQQNFTVHLPFPGVSELPDVAGLNVYGILRAPRIAGTEAVVISVPYNQGNNKGALALMLSFADHCRSKFEKCSKSNHTGPNRTGRMLARSGVILSSKS